MPSFRQFRVVSSFWEVDSFRRESGTLSIPNSLQSFLVCHPLALDMHTRRKRAMLNKCANPGCVRPFRKLEDGKLFLVEVETSAGPAVRGAGGNGKLPRHFEYYWLCEQCALVLTLSFERERGVVAVPLARPMGKMPAASVGLSVAAGTRANKNCGPARMVLGGNK